MPAAALATPSMQPIVRRFDLPDFDRHPWLIKRMSNTFKHLNDRAASSHLRSILYSNEHLFLFCDRAVGLAQVMTAHAFAAQPVILERFVWVENIEDKAAIEEASWMYPEMYNWGKRQNAELMIIEECSDVPHELIRERMAGKRLFERSQKFAKFT